MRADRRFARVSEQIEGRYRRLVVATCDGCGAEDRVTDATRNGAPVELVARQFRNRGWRIGARPGADLCPACRAANAAQPEPTLPAAEPAVSAPPLLINPEPPKVIAMPEPKTALAATAAAAEPPRQPTREDRRRIIEALDEHYLVEKGCYARSFTDKAVAEKLGVPWAWVAEERERAFGPEANEAAAERLAEIDRLEKLARKIEAEGMAAAEKAMAAASQAEDLRRQVERLRSAVGRAA